LSRGRWTKIFLRLQIRTSNRIWGEHLVVRIQDDHNASRAFSRDQTLDWPVIATIQNRATYTIACGGKSSSMVFVFVFVFG
jgi:hypothetical protein